VPVIYTYIDDFERRVKSRRHGATVLSRQPADKA
jgi:hypothetical protein